MFKKKILIGHSEDTVLAIIKHIENSNIPCYIDYKGLKPSSEVYENFYMVKVQKKYTKLVETIVAQYVSQDDLKNWYKTEKKKSRKLKRKENAPYLFAFFIYLNAVGALETSKGLGAYNVSFIVCAVLLMYGVFMTTKYYKEMKKESGDLREDKKTLMIIGILMIFHAVTSFIFVLLRF
ncbi:hypothetical protein ACFVT8_17095 [Lysinibacillus sp. NPDC058147]|uniref:hypothetical protein n=1 Tax=unclassified Lysinibacillus TaxID=2636778 RepID=UPI0036DFA13A